MTYDYDFLQPNFQAKIREISKLKQDLVEREDERMYWYRQFEDAKESDPWVLPKHGSVDIVT